MPYKCSVPACKTGYKSCPVRASSFKLPEDGALREKWKLAITRAARTTDFRFSKNSRICERHFVGTDILRHDVFLIDGKTVRLPRKLPKLKDDAVPCIFEGRPRYSTKVKNKRLSPSALEPVEGTRRPRDIETACSTEVSCIFEAWPCYPTKVKPEPLSPNGLDSAEVPMLPPEEIGASCSTEVTCAFEDCPSYPLKVKKERMSPESRLSAEGPERPQNIGASCSTEVKDIETGSSNDHPPIYSDVSTQTCGRWISSGSYQRLQERVWYLRSQLKKQKMKARAATLLADHKEMSHLSEQQMPIWKRSSRKALLNNATKMCYNKR